MTLGTSAFDLPDRLAAKRNPALIAADDAHLAAITDTLARTVRELTRRLDAERKAPGGSGQEALERDLEIHRLTARLTALRRFGLDLCLGKIVGAAATDTAAAPHGPTVYIGRLGLTDDDGRQLLVDWRSPAAEPFFGATHGNPMGQLSRRRYRWTQGKITDYWDEVFTLDGRENYAALDDQSAFIASLGSSRSARMRDVLGTIQTDQDAIIRASSRGTLVVDGGPGTGKTVVALHRAAYLLYSDPRLSRSHGGLLFVGPSDGYLAYIDDVLPSLGEEGAQTCTIRNLVLEGADAVPEHDPRVAELKAGLLDAIEAAVRHYERPPTKRVTVGTPWADVELGRADWAEAFDSAEAGTPHNDARDRSGRRSSTLPPISSTRTTGRYRASWSAVHSCGTRNWPRPSRRPGRSSIRSVSSPTCGPCPRICGSALRGSRTTTSFSCNERMLAPGRSRTSRSWTPPAAASATPTHPNVGTDGMRRSLASVRSVRA